MKTMSEKFTREWQAHSDARLAEMERTVKAALQMTPSEVEALHAWESEHVTGDGCLTSRDWPGWDDVLKRLAH